jgi:hypothetical protein
MGIAAITAARREMAKEVLTLKGGAAFRKKLEEIAARLGKDNRLEVGFLEDATYPADAGKKVPTKPKAFKNATTQAGGQQVAQVAFWNEFGTSRTPPRPFMRQTVAQGQKTWGAALAKIAVATNYDSEKTLSLMGEGIKGQIQKSINQFTTPELSAATVRQKGFAKPLIDTAVMLRSVDYQVTNDNES